MTLENTIQQHLSRLVEQIGPRPTGSPGNQQAGARIAQVFRAAGWTVETPSFDCLTWRDGGATLRVGDGQFPVQVNPYSPAYEGRSRWVVVDSVDALQAADGLRGTIVVLSGALSASEYMPLNFPFVQIEEQQTILHLLMDAQPTAVIGFHSKPLFCDGDFPLPSVTLDPAHAPHLLASREAEWTLTIASERIASRGCNVIARGTGHQIVFSAHYDTWFGTPGAVDNAAGVVTLLALAEQIRPESAPVELVIFNGEDHYASPGEVLYFGGDLSGIGCNVNVDGVGACEHRPGVAYLGEAPDQFTQYRAIQAQFPRLVEIDPWYESDHTGFVMRGIPALALTSTPFDAWLARTHTPTDTLDGLDVAVLADITRFLQALASAPSAGRDT